MKVIILSAMHGRHKVVSYCLDKIPTTDVVMVFTTTEDKIFLRSQKILKSVYARNEPLSYKWEIGISALKDIDFDVVILLGSDDYIDEKFINYVVDNIKGYDMLCFKDIYFENNGEMYYWSGYENERKGEPIGAGKAYTKEFLERINYSLFNVAKNKSLDSLSWRICKNAKAKILLSSVKENDLMLCDVKTWGGMTSFDKIKHLLNKL
jgi:hypothetical protein